MKKPFKIFIVTSLFTLCSLSVSGQEKVNLAGTIGIPDLISIGARFQMKQSQLGISYGFGTINDSYIKRMSSPWIISTTLVGNPSTRIDDLGTLGADSIIW